MPTVRCWYRTSLLAQWCQNASRRDSDTRECECHPLKENCPVCWSQITILDYFNSMYYISYCSVACITSSQSYKTKGLSQSRTSASLLHSIFLIAAEQNTPLYSFLEMNITFATFLLAALSGMQVVTALDAPEATQAAFDMIRAKIELDRAVNEFLIRKK